MTPSERFQCTPSLIVTPVSLESYGTYTFQGVPIHLLTGTEHVSQRLRMMMGQWFVRSQPQWLRWWPQRYMQRITWWLWTNIEYQLYAALYEWRTGYHQSSEFSANAYLDVYNGHVHTFNHIFENRNGAFHKMMAFIHMRAWVWMYQKHIPYWPNIGITAPLWTLPLPKVFPLRNSTFKNSMTRRVIMVSTTSSPIVLLYVVGILPWWEVLKFLQST